MAQHRPLGRAGGAAGVLQQRQVVQLEALAGGAALAAFEEGLPGRAAQALGPGALLLGLEREEPVLGEGEVVLDAGAHDQLEVELAFDLLVAGPEEVEDHQGAGACVVELVGQLAGGVHGVDVDHGEPRQQRAVEGDDELGAVGQHDGHAVLWFEPRGQQRVSEAFDLVPQPPVAELRTQELERGPVRVALGHLAQHVGQRGGGGQVVGNAFVVVLEPRVSVHARLLRGTG